MELVFHPSLARERQFDLFHHRTAERPLDRKKVTWWGERTNRKEEVSTSMSIHLKNHFGGKIEVTECVRILKNLFSLDFERRI